MPPRNLILDFIVQFYQHISHCVSNICLRSDIAREKRNERYLTWKGGWGRYDDPLWLPYPKLLSISGENLLKRPPHARVPFPPTSSSNPYIHKAGNFIMRLIVFWNLQFKNIVRRRFKKKLSPNYDFVWGAKLQVNWLSNSFIYYVAFWVFSDPPTKPKIWRKILWKIWILLSTCTSSFTCSFNALKVRVKKTQFSFKNLRNASLLSLLKKINDL